MDRVAGRRSRSLFKPMKVDKYQPVLALKPTQFSVGMLEVEYKVLELKNLRAKKVGKLIKKTVVPVVISPWKELCIVDHHHFAFACWHAGIKRVRIEVVKDYSNSKLTYQGFWKRMARQNCAYLYDQFGTGPRSSLYLPLDIRGLADDPYRSLAWMVRQEGGYQNSTKTFAEFAWADLFRGKRLLDSEGRRGFQRAVKRGLRVARSPEARKLPGFSGNKAKRDGAEKAALAKSRYVPKKRANGPVATKLRAR